MNLMEKTVELIDFVHFENLLTPKRDSSLDVFIVALVISLYIMEFFQWLSGSFKNAWGAYQNSLRSQLGISRETRSVGLSFSLICCRLEASVLLRISCTLQ